MLMFFSPNDKIGYWDNEDNSKVPGFNGNIFFVHNL